MLILCDSFAISMPVLRSDCVTFLHSHSFYFAFVMYKYSTHRPHICVPLSQSYCVTLFHSYCVPSFTLIASIDLIFCASHALALPLLRSSYLPFFHSHCLHFVLIVLLFCTLSLSLPLFNSDFVPHLHWHCLFCSLTVCLSCTLTAFLALLLCAFLALSLPLWAPIFHSFPLLHSYCVYSLRFYCGQGLPLGRAEASAIFPVGSCGRCYGRRG